jgi:AcrR family transcriptional regulator
VPRQRLHEPEDLLDAAELLLIEDGRARLTVRALAERAGASNGSIYHAFGSVEDVVGHAWLRRAREFLALQRSAVDAELAAGDPARAVQAAADAPARYAEQNLRAARLLATVDRALVLTDDLDPPLASALRALDAELLDTLGLLARAVFARADAAAVGVISACVVRLPAALLFPGIRAGRIRAHPRAQLAAAVAAVLACGLPG